MLTNFLFSIIRLVIIFTTSEKVKHYFEKTFTGQTFEQFINMLFDIER